MLKVKVICEQGSYNNPCFRSPSRSQVYLQSSCSIDANWSSRIVRNLNFCNHWPRILHGSSPQNLLQYFWFRYLSNRLRVWLFTKILTSFFFQTQLSGMVLTLLCLAPQTLQSPLLPEPIFVMRPKLSALKSGGWESQSKFETNFNWHWFRALTMESPVLTISCSPCWPCFNASPWRGGRACCTGWVESVLSQLVAKIRCNLNRKLLDHNVVCVKYVALIGTRPCLSQHLARGALQ